jgi:hypothetical protein
VTDPVKPPFEDGGVCYEGIPDIENMRVAFLACLVGSERWDEAMIPKVLRGIEIALEQCGWLVANQGNCKGGSDVRTRYRQTSQHTIHKAENDDR